MCPWMTQGNQTFSRTQRLDVLLVKEDAVNPANEKPTVQSPTRATPAASPAAGRPTRFPDRLFVAPVNAGPKSDTFAG
jgi:hypothetical protein